MVRLLPGHWLRRGAGALEGFPLTKIIISAHACQRFVERVRPCTIEQARAELQGYAPIISKAASFGCRVVKLPGRVRIVLDGLTVITVLGRDQWGCRWTPEEREQFNGEKK